MATLDQLIPTLLHNATNLSIRPPIRTNSIYNFSIGQIASDAQQTRIVIHPRFPSLVQSFLEHKRAHGSKYEKTLYSQEGFTWKNEISRLVKKRAVTFMMHGDYTLLRDGQHPPTNMAQEWDRNGTEDQRLNHRLTLEEYLSYDEIMLGSLLGVSGPSFFINDGGRNNRGVKGKPGTFEERGIVIGLVGARFEREDRMDSVFMLPPVKHPKQHPGLTEIFLNFFGKERHGNVGFDAEMYVARMRITIEVLLLEADARAAEEGQGRRAHIYAVGLGLGVWKYDPSSSNQLELYLRGFADAIRKLPLSNVGTIEFAYMDTKESIKGKLRDVGKKSGIRVLFSRRNPAEKLGTDHELLVLSYAWDGNSFPGNEYWLGTASLDASGDPAAACMSTIGELHNPQINPYTKRIKVLDCISK